jgi:hypothetical protein
MIDVAAIQPLEVLRTLGQDHVVDGQRAGEL